MSEVEAVATVLRSFAEARAGPFHDLWIELLAAQSKPQPEIGFRIFRARGPDDADSYTVLSVSGVRSDGKAVSWSVSMSAGSKLYVAGRVEVDDDDGGTAELFTRETAVTDSRSAVAAIHDFASEVCAQRHWWSDSAAT